MHNLFYIRTRREKETRRRIHLSIAAYAYEIENESIMTDAQYDSECLKVDLSVDTARPDLDAWFRENFQPDTGVWIRCHPEIGRIAMLYNRYYKQ